MTNSPAKVADALVLTERPRVLHVTTTAMSLGWLLEPQLRAFDRAGFQVVTASCLLYTSPSPRDRG